MRLDYKSRIDRIDLSNKDEFKKVMSLIKTLRRELESFTYAGDFTDLSLFLEKINEIRPHLEQKKQKNVNAEITKLHSMVRELIATRPSYIQKDDMNFLELKLIIDNLEGMNLSYMYDYVDKYDGDAYSLIRYLLFEEKDLFFVNYALEKYPHIVNLHDNKGNCFILEVVDKYIDAINNYTKDGVLKYNDDLFYYDQVLENLLNSMKIDYSSFVEEVSLNKVKNFLDTFDYSKITPDVKAKLVFWVNELKDKLERRKVEENLSHLSYKTDITISFSEPVLSEVRRFSLQDLKVEYEKREFLKNEFIVTMDGEGAEEIDDGLSVTRLSNGNYLLGVHIADPLAYIKKDNIIYEEAERRTTSIYSPLEQTSLMFPEEYGKDYMSLVPMKNRFGRSYYLEITPYGEVLLDKFVAKKTVIKVNHGVTYDEFNELAQTGSSDRRLDETIKNLREVCDCLSKKIIIDSNYRIANRDSTNASGTNITGNSMSEKIVEFAMLVTGETYANYAEKHGIPILYRGHMLSEEYLAKINYFEQKLKEESSNRNYDVFVKMLKETYPKAFYTTDSNIGHMGLGVRHYAHVTSPLRRFADCLNNEAFDLFYFNKEFKDRDVYQFEKRLKEGCRYINEKKTAIDYFTSRYVKVKKR